MSQRSLHRTLVIKSLQHSSQDHLTLKIEPELPHPLRLCTVIFETLVF